MKTNRHTFRRTLFASVIALGLCAPVMGYAEEKVWEIKPNDTLGLIVAKQYPGYKNRTAIMQALLKANPDAFIGGNLNRLIVGKTLKLPEASSIPGLESPPLPAVAADPALMERLKALEAERAEMEETLKLLEDENASLKAMIKSYEESKQAKEAELAQLTAKLKAVEGGQAAIGATADDVVVLKANVSSLQAENAELKSQLDSTKQELEASTKAATELKAQLEQLKQQSDQVPSVQASPVAAGSNNWLPWLLLGLMALLMLPLLWLLKRKHTEPRITTVAVPKESSAMPIGVATLDATPSYSDTTPPPVEVKLVETPETPAPAIVNLEPETPEAELKLDIARAYLDLRQADAASEILKEVMQEGGNRQRQEAREILSFIT